MPSAAAIVARSWPDHVIGVDNKLPWHLRTDLQNFKKLTSGHAIIMGRKTYASIGRPLPNRHNIVLSRTPVDEASGLQWARDIETALLLADVHSIINRKTEFFVIGGEQIYELFLKYINRVYLTEVFARVNGDAKFDYEFDRKVWRYKREDEYPATDVDDHAFRISELVKLKPFHRFESKMRFLGFTGSFDDLFAEYERLVAKEDHAAQDEDPSLL
ncbi:MAG: dihydrofolate reductase [Alphaproteobacteria bacterium]|nr:MAG: dihydrofolate reductase [Alphaproteobacteria bacterium]